MSKCINKWTTDIDSLTVKEYEKLANHAETCAFHSDILDRYEADALPFIKLAFSVMPETDRPKGSYAPRKVFHNFEGTSITCFPKRHLPKNRTFEEEIMSEKIRQILATGGTPENHRRYAEFLEENESIVRNSWSHTLNKARVFTYLGERREARRVIQFVMDKYTNSRATCAQAMEIMSWHEELDFNAGGRVDRQILDRRIDYINKGLEFQPEQFMLLINAFEAACLKNFVAPAKKSVDSALVYLNKLVKIDEQYTEQYFLNCPVNKEIISSDDKLKKAVFKLNPNLKQTLIN